MIKLLFPPEQTTHESLRWVTDLLGHCVSNFNDTTHCKPFERVYMRSPRQLKADAKRRNWTKTYWENLRANPWLYQQHIKKMSTAIKRGYLRQRMNGSFNGKPGKPSNGVEQKLSTLGKAMRPLFWLLVLTIASCKPQPKEVFLPESRDKNGKMTRAAVTWRSDGTPQNIQWIHDHCANVDPIPLECRSYLVTDSPTPNVSQTPNPSPTSTSTPGPSASPTATKTPTPTASATPGLVPIAPSNVRATPAPTCLAITVTWQDNSNNETGFRVEHSMDGLSFPYVDLVPANTTSFTITGLSSSTLRYNRVLAYNTSGNSAPSNVATSASNACTTATPTPTPVPSPTATATATVAPTPAVIILQPGQSVLITVPTQP